MCMLLFIDPIWLGMPRGSEMANAIRINRFYAISFSNADGFGFCVYKGEIFIKNRS